jgi:hypothetical protein
VLQYYWVSECHIFTREIEVAARAVVRTAVPFEVDADCRDKARFCRLQSSRVPFTRIQSAVYNILLCSLYGSHRVLFIETYA